MKSIIVVREGDITPQRLLRPSVCRLETQAQLQDVVGYAQPEDAVGSAEPQDAVGYAQAQDAVGSAENGLGSEGVLVLVTVTLVLTATVVAATLLVQAKASALSEERLSLAAARLAALASKCVAQPLVWPVQQRRTMALRQAP